MSKAALDRNFDHLKINKNGKVVDISGADPFGARTTTFDYYESLFAPYLTANITFVDVGRSIEYDTKYDPQGRIGSLYNALPITGDGSERVEFKIRAGDLFLDFIRDYFIVNGAVDLGKESNRQGVALSLISQTGLKNRETYVSKKYITPISQSVYNIAKSILEIPENKLDIETTKNKYCFAGNGIPPCEWLLSLSSKALPEKGNPGFFFYETREGHKFKSIDSLISQEPVYTYFKNDVNQANQQSDVNNFKILRHSVNKNQSLINALKAGVYKSRQVYFNPKTFKEEEILFNVDDGITRLGKEVAIPELDSYTRTTFDILDVGTLSPTPKDQFSSNPKEWQGKSQMRFNLLFTQVVSIQVPCNLNLKAGDTINCNFEITTQDKKEQGAIDPVESGKYLIVNLCHHFDPLRAFTSLTLVRDSYGLYTSKNKG